jgi:hypothetical protein
MNFNVKTFVIAAILIFILTFLSFIAAGAVDEGTDGAGLIGVITYLFSILFYIFRFPTHSLFFEYMTGSIFYIGLLINCLFWALIIERIFRLIKSKKNASR